MPESDQSVPELVGGVDIRTLPLSALDGFVLSRIDGRTRCGEIVAMTGLSSEQVNEIIGRLVALGAVRVQPGTQASPRAVRPAGSAGPTGSMHSGMRGPAASAPGGFPSGTYGVQSAPPQSGPPVVSSNAASHRPSSASFPPVSEAPGGSPSGRSRRTTSSPPGSSSTPPRRRPSMPGTAPRRMFSESTISSGPPPEMRSMPPRARVSTPSRPRTPIPPQGASASVAPPARTPVPQRGLADSGAPTPPPAPPAHGATESRAPSAPGRESISVTLPPLSLPPSMSGPPLFGAPAITRELSEGSAAPSDEGGAARPPHAQSSLQPPRPSAPAALYDQRELDEENDLPRERRKQVLDLFYQLSQLDYYALLGVAQGADKKEIRSAYFSLSKAFHPDSMFRKELGSYKAKMTAVFQALTEAYEALGKKKSRDEYDAYLRSTRQVQQVERVLATEEVAQADVAVEVPRPPPLPHTDYQLPPPTPIPAPPREMTPEAKRIARELVERRLRGLPARPAAASPPAAPAGSRPSVKPAIPPRPSTPLDRQELMKQLGRTLIDVGRVTGGADKLGREVTAARAAFERGDIAASVQHMARAFSLAPERADLHQEYERLSRMLAQQMASEYEEQAKFEMKQAKWAAAAHNWTKVCEGRPEDASAHRHAAYSLLKAGGDLRGAQKYAQQAVFLAPNDIDCRVLLAQTYLTVGLKLNAKRELDAAAKLDPDHEVVKNLLSDLAK